MKPHTVVYAAEMTEEIQRMIDILSTNEAPITALQNEDNIVILQPEEIYMVKIEGGDTMIFGETQKYRSRRDCTNWNNSLEGNSFSSCILSYLYVILCKSIFYKSLKHL